MSSRSIHVLRPGLHTTVQDLGRWGFQSQGVPVAGPMDLFSHRYANALVGNSRDAATLEITLIGPELEFEGDCIVACAGAEFAVLVDGAAVPLAQAFRVPAGAKLQFGARSRGTRAYLAVDGGFDVPVVLGSRSTHVPSGIGGWGGRALHRGDRLPLGTSERRPVPGGRQSTHAHDTLPDSAILRALSGPDLDRFRGDALGALQSAPYAIGPDSDRMGFRLHGPRLRHADGADIISDATPTGSVQVPGSGEPILLMADRQTTGGYSRIATVITADLGIAGQRGPGDTVMFRICTPAEALSALIARENALLAVEAAWS
jgi:antagonist of KipI